MRKIIIVVLLASVSIGTFFLINNSEPTKPLESFFDGKRARDNEPTSQGHADFSNQKVIAQIIHHAGSVLKTQAKINEMRKEFVALNALKGNLNKHEMRRRSLQSMVNNQQSIMLAERVFADFEWVKTEFEHDQAIVRIYAIELLKMRGQLGEVAPLEHATQTLAKKLASDPNEWQKGREHDLRDLVGAVIELEGRETILSDVKTFFARVGYTPKLKQIYASAITSYLYRSSTDSEVDESFKPFWNDTL